MIEEIVPARSPERYLHVLNRHLTALIAAAPTARDNGLRDEVLGLYRRTALAELFYNRYVVAIAGMQGVGKSTLLRQLYELPAGWLPENVGRGERLPVLVTEYEGENVQARVIRWNDKAGALDDTHALQQQELATRARDPQEGDLWLELRVPFRHFGRSDMAFMLLPGIEPTREQRESEWQAFVRYALTMASSCVLVFDQTKLAQGQNRALAETIMTEFKDARPVLALSFADQRTSEENELFRRQVLTQFAIPEEEADRVILTGAGEYTKAWTGQLRAALGRYLVTHRSFRRNQMRYLDDLLAQLGQAVGKLETAVAEHDLEEEADAGSTKSLQLFDQTRDNLRAMVERKLQPVVAAHRKQVMNEVKHLIAAKGGWTQVKELFLSKSYKEHNDFENAIQAAWHKTAVGDQSASAGDDAIIGVKCNRALQELLGARLETVYGSLPARQPASPPDVYLLANIGGFLQGHSETAAAGLEPASLKLMPLLGLERISQALVASHIATPQDDSKFLLPDPKATKLPEAKFAPPTIVKGAALLFGIDAIDGTIDSVPSLLKALGIPVATGAVSVAVGLAGALSLAYLATTAFRQVTRQDFADEGAARALTDELGQAYLAGVMNYFDDVMALIRERLEGQTNLLLHKDDAFIRWERLRYAAANVQNSIQNIQEHIHDALGILG